MNDFTRSFKSRFARPEDLPATPIAPAARAAVAPPAALVVNHRPVAAKQPYEAWDGNEQVQQNKDRVRRLDIRRADGAAHALAYSYLPSINYDRKRCTEIYFTHDGVSFTIVGRNLLNVARALCLEQCEFLQEFDAELFEPPVDPAAPFIEHIYVEVLKAVPKPPTEGN